MGWNDPGNNNPWNTGGGNNGNRGGNKNEPDLDELAKKLQEKLSGIFGGGSGGNGKSSAGGNAGLFGLLLAGLIIAAAFSAMHKINPGEEGVVLRFGKDVNTTLQPGLSVRMPWPIETVQRVDVKQVRETAFNGTMLTQDDNLVDILLTVQYRISDAREYLFYDQLPHVTMGKATASAIREVIGKTSMEGALKDDRIGVANRTMETLQEILNNYRTGLKVSSVNLDRSQAPKEVQGAFEDAIKAGTDKERMKNEAEAYANDVVPKARGAAARIVQEAQGYRDSVIARAEGEASRFDQLLKEYRRSPRVLRDRLYLDAMEEVLSSTSKVIVDNKDGGNTLMYLPIDKLIEKGNKTSQSSTSNANTKSTSSGSTVSAPVNNTRSRDRYRETR